MCQNYNSEHITKSFELFAEGGSESAIMIICSHESLVQDQKLCEVYQTVSVLINMKNTAIQSLDPTSDKALIKELKGAINKLNTICKVTQQEVFDYFGQLFSCKHMPKA